MAREAKESRGDRREAERDVVNAVRRILRALRLAANTTQSSLGISAAQLYVLRHLAEHEVVSISELSQLTLTDRSSVAAVVDRLVEQGLASRAPSSSDRRRASVRITRQGARLATGSSPAPMDNLVNALRGMGDGEVTDLARSLTGLVAAMGLEATPAEMLFEEGTPRAPEPPVPPET